MIISISAAKTLVDFLQLDDSVKMPNGCPECDRNLWKHGKRRRICESFQMCARLEIQRLFCKPCRKTFSVMPSFLEPGVRFERLVTETYISAVAEGESTYREVAWSENDQEREDASASLSRVFRAVSKALKQVAENILNLHQQTLKTLSSRNLAFTHQVNSTCSPYAKSHSKQRQLKLLMLLLTQLRNLFSNDNRVICEAYRSLCLGFPLPTPHSVQQALF